MSCEISVIYPGLENKAVKLEIPETRRSFGVVSFGSDPSVCFGSAPGMGGFVLDPWEAKEYGILPRHCALLWAGGKFRLEFDRHAGVYLNGSETCARSFCNPFEDGAEFTMRLGLPEQSLRGHNSGVAPVFKIRRHDQAHQKTGFLTALALRFDWFRKVAMMPFLVRLPALVMGVLALGIILTAWNFSQSQRITEALIRGDIPQAIGTDLAPSVASIGMVCDGDPNTRFKPYGTGWLYQHIDAQQRASRWLITNLHVVRQIEQNECPPGTGSRTTVAMFPGIQGNRIEALPLSLTTRPRIHPLHDAFEAFRSEFENRIEGQQAVANIYDIAAFELTGDDAASIASDRKFLTLGKDIPETAWSFATDVNFTQNLDPGRPVLILSYPTENQPFLADGVPSDPFQFRTTLQSKSNAMSRSIPGQSSNRTPALYSFAAKSAGGMSGSPVIALDKNGDPFVSAIVFSSSFVRGPGTTAGGGPQRLANGDGTYALDTTSLISIADWPDSDSNQSDVLDISADQLKAIRAVWTSWSNDQSPLDETRQRFTDLNRGYEKRFESEGLQLRICAATKMLKLSRKAPGEQLVPARGETRKPVKLQFSEHAKNTLLVVESRSKRDDDQLLQLAISTKRNGKRATTQMTGLNQASYLKAGDAPLEAEISAAGPYKSELVLTILEAVDQTQTCPNRETWND